jgi:hypothetical protein
MRYFTIIDYPEINKNYGRYAGKSPGKAASKAFTSLAKKINLSNNTSNKQLVLHLKELNSPNKKIYKYIGSRVKLVRPITVYINGKTVEFNYKNIITNIKI